MGFGQWLFGGGQTEGMPTGPAHGAQDSSYIQNQLANGTHTAAPTFGSTDATAARAQQMMLADQLRRISQGTQVGAGEMAVNRQVGQAQAAQQAGALAARGQNAALAGRQAARGTADLGVNGAGMAAQAQLQDQSNAMGQLGGLLGGMRGQDINIGQGNQQAQLAQTGMNNQYGLGLLGSQLGIDQSALQQDAMRRQIAAQDKGMFGQLLAAGGQVGAAYATGGLGGHSGGGGGSPGYPSAAGMGNIGSGPGIGDYLSGINPFGAPQEPKPDPWA